LGWIRTITRGVFNEYQNIDPNNHKKNNDVYYRATASVNFGSSGGGLFQPVGEGYELIGITSMKVRGTDFMNLFVPLENIRDFLRLEKRAKEIRDSLKINLEEFPGERF
jgi:S1-C subfamily serine protease